MSESEEDDYMSFNVSNIPDIKPGVAKSREEQRQLKISAHRDAVTRPLPRHELEAQRRQEALNKPVDETNKGFNLLAKMGYKPGMMIGKVGTDETQNTRTREPIDLKIKLSRTGLGHETMEKEQQQERCEAHMSKMQTQAKMSDVLAQDFRKRKREVAVTRLLIGDVVRARKACQDLDMRSGIQKPDRSHLWPVHKLPDPLTSTEDSTSMKRTRLLGEVSHRNYYSTGEEAEPECSLDEMDAEGLGNKLTIVDSYLRERHSYCLWCGCAYENAEELANLCPGPSKDDHD